MIATWICGKFRRLAVGLWILKGISLFFREMSASKEGADYNCKKKNRSFI